MCGKGVILWSEGNVKERRRAGDEWLLIVSGRPVWLSPPSKRHQVDCQHRCHHVKVRNRFGRRRVNRTGVLFPRTPLRRPSCSYGDGRVKFWWGGRVERVWRWRRRMTIKSIRRVGHRRLGETPLHFPRNARKPPLPLRTMSLPSLTFDIRTQ